MIMHGNGSRSLFIRTVTVGLGISPSLLTLFTYAQRNQALVGYAVILAITTGGESRPALRTSLTC